MSEEWWWRQAACKDTADERAFGRSTEQAAFIREFCRHCEVKRPCFEYAVEVDSDGVFGGTTRRQRAAAGVVPKAADRRAPCGTRTAYVGHRRRGEEPCGPCRAAAAEYQRDLVRRRRPA